MSKRERIYGGAVVLALLLVVGAAISINLTLAKSDWGASVAALVALPSVAVIMYQSYQTRRAADAANQGRRLLSAARA